MTQPQSDARPEKWLSADVLESNAYHVDAVDGAIKLDAMELPWRWPPALLDAWQGHLKQAAVNLYPDSGSSCVVTRLRDYWDIDDSLSVMVGNGSDELIALIVGAIGGVGRTILAPTPSFAMYPITARNTRTDYVAVALNDNFSLDLDNTLAAINEHQPACIFISSPNNPTGNVISRDAIEAIIQAAPGLVVVDEAYYAFAEDSFLHDTARHSHLLVLRTLSKVGFAGLRLGAMVGQSLWMDQLDKFRLPYNINVLSQISADFALQHTAFIDDCVSRICTERQRLENALASIDALTVYPSATNFLLIKCPAQTGTATFEALRDRGILVRDFSRAPGLTDCLRVSIGLPEHNDQLVVALQSLFTHESV